MGFPENVLTRGEKVEKSLHPHWRTVVGPMVIGLHPHRGLHPTPPISRPTTPRATASSGSPSRVGVLIGIPAVIVPFLRWRTTHYVITTHRVMVRRGIVNKNGKDITLSKITDVSFQQTLLDRIIGSGTLQHRVGRRQPRRGPSRRSRAATGPAALNRLIDEDDQPPRAQRIVNRAGFETGPGGRRPDARRGAAITREEERLARPARLAERAPPSARRVGETHGDRPLEPRRTTTAAGGARAHPRRNDDRRCRRGRARPTAYRAARDQLLGLARRPRAARVREFRWPDVGRPVQLGGRLVRRRSPAATTAPALVIVEEDEPSRVGAQLRRDGPPLRPGRGLARRARASAAGDAVIVMLGNQVELWESMLAVMKLGAVIMPTTTAVGPGRPRRPDRPRRRARSSSPTPSDARKFDEVPGDYGRVAVTRGEPLPTAGRRSTTHTRLDVPPRRAPGHRARRPAAALLHLRHHEPAQAGRAHPGVLPRRAPLDDVLARPAARRRAPQHLLARAGPSTRGRASSRRGSPRRRSSSTTTRASTPAALLGVLREHEVTSLLRAADGVADADQRRPLRRPGRAARGDRRRRAAQPRGHRAGADARGA